MPNVGSSGPRLSVKSDHFRLGVVYLKGLEAAYAAIGANNSTIDSKAATQAVIDDINKRGGVAGRSIQPSYFAVDANSSQDRASQLEAACAYFTQDRPVDIVVSYTGGALISCLAKRGVPLINGYPGSGTPAEDFAAHPLYFAPAQLSLSRLAPLLASHLVSQHWIDSRWTSRERCATVKEPRLGVVTFDRPGWRDAYAKALAPAFKSRGHPVVDVAFLEANGNTAQQLASVSAGIQNAILKFSTDCIDHVAFFADVAVDALFMAAADEQDYHPRYGLSSLESPPVIIPNLPEPNSQLRGAIGPGWAPFMDVDQKDFDAVARAPAGACLNVLRKAGHVPQDNNATILALPSCEGPYFAVEILTRWVKAGGSKTLARVAAEMGSAYGAAGTYSTFFDTSKRDGASGYRGFAYVESCTCFRYTSAVQAL